MSKGRSGSYLLKRSQDNPALTRFFADKLSLTTKDVWLFTLKPETGKTHQLRVALKSLGSPILGDQRYSGAPASRGYLHAYKVRFELFNKRYDIIDPFWGGEEFSFSDLANKLGLDPQTTDNVRVNLSNPEQLAWPKPSYLLPN